MVALKTTFQEFTQPTHRRQHMTYAHRGQDKDSVKGFKCEECGLVSVKFTKIFAFYLYYLHSETPL